MNLYLKNGVADPYGSDDIIREVGPVIAGIDSVSMVGGAPQFHMVSEVAATEASLRLGWVMRDDCTIGVDSYGECLRVEQPGEPVVFYSEWTVSEATTFFRIKVGEVAAALMQGICHVDANGHSDLQELYALSDSGMVGPWVCCAEVGVEYERRYGALIESQGRNYLDDTEWLPGYIMLVAREIRKQPQGTEEIARVLDLFEQNHPTEHD